MMWLILIFEIKCFHYDKSKHFKCHISITRKKVGEGVTSTKNANVRTGILEFAVARVIAQKIAVIVRDHLQDHAVEAKVQNVAIKNANVQLAPLALLV